MLCETDLSNTEWNLIKKYFEPASKRGNEHNHDKKHRLNAMLYIVKDGIQWQLMPNDFSPWQAVYYHIRKWYKGGVWEKCLDRLRWAYNRQKAEYTTNPSYLESMQSLLPG